MDTWKGSAKLKTGRDYNFSFLEHLTEVQKDTLNTWLMRLAESKDFNKSRKDLSDVVCSMLESLNDCPEFFEVFFIQAEINNEQCGDRAAMSLNEIYTSWKIITLDYDASLSTKLTLLVGMAKTETLRAEISQNIFNRQLLKQKVEEESVEIYLYYETVLREEFGLVSAIQRMSHSMLGNRNWIDKEHLKYVIRTEYISKLLDHPVFRSLVEKDPVYQEKEKEILDAANEKLKNCESLVPYESGGLMRKVTREKELLIEGNVKEYLSKHLGS